MENENKNPMIFTAPCGNSILIYVRQNIPLRITTQTWQNIFKNISLKALTRQYQYNKNLQF